MKREMKPVYKHDCNKCTYIATIGALGKLADIYRSCDDTTGVSYILRCSDDPPDYATTHAPDGGIVTSAFEDDHLVYSLNHWICEEIERKVNREKAEEARKLEYEEKRKRELEDLENA